MSLKHFDARFDKEQCPMVRVVMCNPHDWKVQNCTFVKGHTGHHSSLYGQVNGLWAENVVVQVDGRVER